MSSEEEKYQKLRESLRSLPRIKAKNDFEARLYRRIREHEKRKYPVPEKENTFITMLANLFKPSLVPAIGLTVVLLAVIVVYFAYFNELTKDKQVPTVQSYDEKKGEFVIYVKKDSERVYDETATDITSSELNRSATTEEYKPSTDADYYKLSQPEAPSDKDAEKKMKEDRISDEQKIIMEKESDDYKSQPKSEDGKIMKKGYIEKEETPLNIREEKEDTGIKNEEKLEEQKQIAPEGEINQGVDTSKKIDEDRKKRIKKDSLKTKDKGIEEQKDTIEK